MAKLGARWRAVLVSLLALVLLAAPAMAGFAASRVIIDNKGQPGIDNKEVNQSLINLEKELIRLGISPEEIKQLQEEREKLSTRANLFGLNCPNWGWYPSIPGTPYRLIISWHQHYIRCAGGKACHINLGLQKSGKGIFNLHIGAARNKQTNKIVVFAFNNQNPKFEVCKQISNINEIKSTVAEFLNRYLSTINYSLPAWVITAIATIVTYALLLGGILVAL